MIELAKNRRNVRVLIVVRIECGVVGKALARHGWIAFPVFLVGGAGRCQICPGRDGNDPGGDILTLCFPLERQGIDQAPARRLTAKDDLTAVIAAAE